MTSNQERTPLERAKGAGINFFNRPPPQADDQNAGSGAPTAYELAMTDKWNSRRLKKKSLRQKMRGLSATRRRSSFDEYCEYLGIEETIGAAKVRQWRAVFDMYDEGKTNTISGSDLVMCVRQAGFNPTVPRLVEILNNLDEDSPSGMTFYENRKIDKDTTVSFYEFVHITYIVEQEEQDLVDILFLAFRFLDADGNGTLSKEEFETVMMSVGDTLSKEEVDKTFEFFDMDGNGEIEYHEFLNFFRRQDLESVTVFPGDKIAGCKPKKSQRDIKKALLSQRSQMREKIKRNATQQRRQSVTESSFARNSTLLRTASDSSVIVGGPGDGDQSSMRRSRMSLPRPQAISSSSPGTTGTRTPIEDDCQTGDLPTLKSSPLMLS